MSRTTVYRLLALPPYVRKPAGSQVDRQGRHELARRISPDRTRVGDGRCWSNDRRIAAYGSFTLIAHERHAERTNGDSRRTASTAGSSVIAVSTETARIEIRQGTGVSSS
jgi:hypothetical protein